MRLFGGYGVFCNGLMFGLIAGDTLYFRADDVSKEAYSAEACEPFSYEANGRPIRLPYWRVPVRLFEEREAMVAWATEALAAARRARAGKEKAPRPRRRARRD